MEKKDEQVILETNEARAGSTPHILRYILMVSMALAIIGMGLVWWIGRGSRMGRRLIPPDHVV